jgi:serine/threonine-protein kinase
MATVHLARAVGAGGFERLVAIKSMHPGFASDEKFVAMFLDEARVAARIRHPNVVATLDVEQDDEGLFLVMEFVEGPSLSAMLRALKRRGDPMPPGIALRILIDALLGLHAAHEQTGPEGEPLNVVHRDVSPQNILVGLDGLAKITDFGVALAEARLSSTRGGEVKGKLGYMAPQQVRAEPIDRRADVYALGVVLWEVLVGARLFAADNDAAVVHLVLAGPKASPREVRPEIPEPLDRACMRALRADSDARYPTALAFADALEAAAAEANAPIASARAVAAFVKELGAHKPLAIPPAQPAAARAREQRPSHPSANSGAVATAGSGNAATSRLAPRASISESQVSSVVSSIDTPRAGARGRGVAVGAAMVVVGLGGLAAGARFFRPTEQPAATASPGPGSALEAGGRSPPGPPEERPAVAASVSPNVSVAEMPSASASPPQKKSAPRAPAKARTAAGDEWRPGGL